MLVEKIDTFSGHRDSVYSLERTPDKQHFFSAGGDGLVVRWNLEKPDVGELIAKVPASVYAMCYEEKSKQLWVGQNFEGIHVFDIENKQEVKSIKITSSSIFDIKMYENLAIVCLGDGTVIIMSIQEFAVVKHLKASDKSARCVEINPHKREFAVGYSDFSVKIFDLQDFSLKFVIKAHTNSVFTLKYTPDYRFLVSGSRDAHLKAWNVEKQYSLENDIVAHLFAINHLTFSPDGKFFATCSMDKSIKVWDAETFRLLKVIDRARHAGHGTSVNRLWWSEYENQLVSASDDKKISVWKLS
ncbi:WD domain-containing protein, G-beta repeat-containing protein [Pseudarcicella hirudinis]|uniref:WD domain-containing protein, G-beta repeat-containing protein n=1 Tax=Pseudarcicella hirudinis TaxID=1079859 RepID=A0A1I5WCA2_9BACT|nr:WD40 repeat domain-containing protein [Pseudarcicella hirudinis]SFQ17352.1 WD domain-containing protein, G-beta repeat-containing protein [Pseudarcicella hirudinis]